jgi:hypothetical protein
MTDYKVDGFRFDFSKGFTNTPGDGGAYDASRISILKRIADKMWLVNPNAYVILEHFTANTEEKELAEYGMMLWGNMNSQYCEAAMGYTSDLSYATSQSRGWAVPNLVTYMESHDEERVMFKTITYGNTAGSYNTKDLPTALKRMELNTVFFLTIPGPKMIWQFEELGYDVSIESGGRTSNKPIKWDYVGTSTRYRLYLIYKLLNNLRRTQDVFSTSDYSYSLSNPLKRINLNSPSMNVTILGNFDVNTGTIIPGFQQTGKWYEYFTGDSITVDAINAPITFQPGEYRLYTTKRFSSPKLLLGIEDQELPGTNHFVSVYPNPSPYEFTFEIRASQPSSVTVSIFDLGGRIIRLEKTDISTEGVQIFKWDGKTASGSEAGKGIYFVQIRTKQRSETVKIIKK